MAGKFELFKNNENKFQFRLKSGGNGQSIICSKEYAAKQHALTAINAVKSMTSSSQLVIEEIEGSYYLQVYTVLGHPLAVSTTHKNKTSVEKLMASVILEAKYAEILDLCIDGRSGKAKITEKVVWKYDILPQTEFTVRLPVDHKILSIGTQSQSAKMWVLVDSNARTRGYTFVVYGTGHKIMWENTLEFIDTFHVQGMVFHLFKKN